MKKILLALVLSISLSGCAALAQFRNPVDITTLAQIESSYALALTGAVAYHDACEKKIIVRTTCAPVVAKLQAADKKVQIALINARKFIKENPTVSAISVIELVKNAVTAFRQIAVESGAN